MLQSLLILSSVCLLTAPANAMCVEQSKPIPHRISVHLVSAPLSELMKALAKQTRLSWKRSRDLPDLRVTAIAQDMPLPTFRDRLAETLHLSWKEETNPEKTLVTGYTLYKSPRDLQEEQYLLSKSEQALHERFDLAVRASYWSKKERERQLDPQSQLAASLQIRQFEASFRYLGRLSPFQREQLLDGQDSVASYDKSGTPLQMELKNLLDSMGWEADSPTTVRFHRDGGYGDAGVLVEVKDFRGRTSGSRIPLLQREEVYPADATKRDREEYRAARKSFRLEREIADAKFDKALEQIAEATGVAIISESYPDYSPFPLSAPQGETTLEKLFDSMMLNHRFWRKRGDAYLVQSEYWFIERRFQVDAALVKRFKETLQKRGLTLEEWGELGRLSYEQWMALQTLKVGEFDVIAISHRPLLAFYGALPESQKRELFEGDGVNVSDLAPSDMSRLEKWANSLAGANPDLSRYPKEAYRISAKKGEGTTLFRLAVLSGGGERIAAEQTMFAAPKAIGEAAPAAKK